VTAHHTLGARAALTVVCAALGAMLASVNLAAPLYATYQAEFGFSSLTLTLVFATYAIVLIPSLMVFGKMSDHVGRRPVMLCGLAMAVVGLLLFALANGLAWLYAARVAQGVAVGMTTGTATAALVELEPDVGARRPALLSAIAQAGGSSAGPLVGGLLAEDAPDPLVTPFVIALAVIAVLAALVLLVPETSLGRGARWRPQLPGVPVEIRGAFARVAITAAAVWGVAGLYLSVVPSYVTEITGTTNLLAVGALAAVMPLSSCAAQLTTRNVSSAAATQAAGLGLLAVGLVGLVLAAPTGLVTVLLAGSALSGIGHGIAFLAAQDDLNKIAPPHRRGEVTAAFVTCIYLGVSVSAVGVGLLADAYSLSTGVAVFAVVTGCAALAVALWHLLAARGNERESVPASR
jgi:MFS family permease